MSYFHRIFSSRISMKLPYLAYQARSLPRKQAQDLFSRLDCSGTAVVSVLCERVVVTRMFLPRINIRTKLLGNACGNALSFSPLLLQRSRHCNLSYSPPPIIIRVVGIPRTQQRKNKDKTNENKEDKNNKRRNEKDEKEGRQEGE